jgi:hypothetical protein
MVRHLKMKVRTRSQLWQRFDSVRTKETHGDGESLLNNLVSLNIPTPCSHHEVVEKIAANSQTPIPIYSLAGDLSRRKLERGKSIFGFVGDEIDKIASQYDDMYWWISKEGLNVTVVAPAAAKLSRFDEMAGSLYVAMAKDGRLSKEMLGAIARKLDAAYFGLDELQPAQWKPISFYNQRHARKAIRTFEQACRHSVYVRSIRRRLYVAHERYTKANPTKPSSHRMS